MFNTFYITFIFLGITFHASGENFRRGDVLLGIDSVITTSKQEKIAIVKIFHSLDHNQDRVIDINDFKNQHFNTNKKIEFLIKIADVNHDKKVTYGELFDAKELIQEEFQPLKASMKPSLDPDNVQWDFFEDYGLAIGLFGLVILIAGFKFI